MTRKQLKKEVKKLTKERREWERRGIGYRAPIMFDRSDGEVWIDTFMNEGDFKRYRSDSIESVPVTDIIYQNTGSHPMTVDEIDEAIVEYIVSRCKGVFEGEGDHAKRFD